jgi:flagellar hook-associated protein 1 FlgK
MDSFDIGVSGFNAAQYAFGIIGNNIANAATEGYHRQKMNLLPAYSSQVGNVLLGGGVNVAGVTRMIDMLLENEILRQQSSFGQISKEVGTLRTVETAFGELSGGSGLNEVIDEFFNALQDISAHPSEIVWQNQVVTTADMMASRFRSLDAFLTNMEYQITLDAEQTIQKINSLISTMAQLNTDIERQEIIGGQANSLRDQRDKCISELSKLINVQTQSRDYGVVDISIGGIPVLTGSSAIVLETGLNDDLELGVSISGEFNYQTDIEGGELGGLLSLKNTLVSDVHSDLNTLASAMIQQMNNYHVQGVGPEGSFTSLTGWSMISEDFADIDPPVTDGNIYIRVTNTSTGEITRTLVPIDVSADSLSSLATDITNTVTGLTASVSDSKLFIQAESGYEFDFLPCVLPLPKDSDYTGASSPPDVSVSGIYSGTENQTFTFTVSGSNTVGNGSLELIVTDESANTIATLNIGSGYAAGDILNVGNGIKITLGIGDLVDDNTFEVEAFADTDTTGVLAAIGINTFFFGKDASDIAVCTDISNTPARIATALGADMSDNTNALRFAGLRDQTISSLNSMTPGGYYQKLVTDIGQDLSIRQLQEENIEAIVQNLINQQGEVSGVDINEEAAQMLVFEQMFTAMAKYLNTVQSSLTTLMGLL